MNYRLDGGSRDYNQEPKKLYLDGCYPGQNERSEDYPPLDKSIDIPHSNPHIETLRILCKQHNIPFRIKSNKTVEIASGAFDCAPKATYRTNVVKLPTGYRTQDEFAPGLNVPEFRDAILTLDATGIEVVDVGETSTFWEAKIKFWRLIYGDTRTNSKDEGGDKGAKITETANRAALRVIDGDGGGEGQAGGVEGAGQVEKEVAYG